MIEKLLVYAILLDTFLVSEIEYNKILDEFFLQEETNELLLELEWGVCTGNTLNSAQIIKNAILHSTKTIKYDKFGQLLFEKLACIYQRKDLNLIEFGSKMYMVWKSLPSTIAEDEPFYTLSYADDCLSYGDEKQTRELYQKAFEYYETKK